MICDVFHNITSCNLFLVILILCQHWYVLCHWWNHCLGIWVLKITFFCCCQIVFHEGKWFCWWYHMTKYYLLVAPQLVHIFCKNAIMYVICVLRVNDTHDLCILCECLLVHKTSKRKIEFLICHHHET